MIAPAPSSMEHHGCRSSNAANKNKIMTTSTASQLHPKSLPSSEDGLVCTNRIPSFDASSPSTPTPFYKDVASDQATE
uniref:Ovule protein n=1 Tax=Steinernema glaseri TaxID=37863 RepID=A0A1I7ZYV7_9BILA